jgi:hypothetical protein
MQALQSDDTNETTALAILGIFQEMVITNVAMLHSTNVYIA